MHGADGVVVGHQYSLLGRVMHKKGAWVGVEDCERIPTDKTPVQVGAEQVARLRENSSETVKHIITADSEYLTEEMLDQAHERTQLLIRLRGNGPAPRTGRAASKGHFWTGEPTIACSIIGAYPNNAAMHIGMGPKVQIFEYHDLSPTTVFVVHVD